MTNSINVSTATKRWLEATLTAEEITRWGVDTIRALAQLSDNLDKENQCEV